MSKIEEITNNLASLEQQLETAAKEAVKPFFEAVFEEYPEIPKIVVVGETPYFNDGDPCVHGQHVVYDLHTAQEWGRLEADGYHLDDIDPEEAELFGSFLPEECNGIIPNYGTKHNPDWDSPERKALNERYKPLDNAFEGMEDAIHRAFGTDFILIVTREIDGGVDIEVRENVDHD